MIRRLLTHLAADPYRAVAVAYVLCIPLVPAIAVYRIVEKLCRK